MTRRWLSTLAGDDGEASSLSFLKEIGYEDDVSVGIIKALRTSGMPSSALPGMVRSMAGRWEVGHDAGLLDLARAVEVDLAQTRGKQVVRFSVVVPHAGGRTFECEGLEGMSVRDVREHGGMKGGAELREYIECACSGVMACSTCHVVVDPAWYGKFEAPHVAESVSFESRHLHVQTCHHHHHAGRLAFLCPHSSTAFRRGTVPRPHHQTRGQRRSYLLTRAPMLQDMIDLAFEPTETSRLGCQLVLSKKVNGFVVRVPSGANNLFDHIPFEDGGRQ